MRAAVFLTALLATALPAAAQDIPGTEFTFGLWRGAAQSDAAGAFTHCYATLVFGSGDQLWINVSAKERVEVIFSFVKQSYRPDQTFQASLMLESGLPTHGEAQALGGSLISFNMAPVDDAHAFLSQGNWLRLMGVGNDEAYDVRGLGGVLGEVRACRESQRQ
jgi:hypothetical protein